MMVVSERTVSMVDCIFFFKQKTAYEMRISDGSSDVCSSDLASDQCDVAGQILSVAGGRVSRVVGAEPLGYYSKELTPEQVRDNWGTIAALDDLIVPDNANEEIGQLLNVVTG